jgi:hypothetical protein
MVLGMTLEAVIAESIHVQYADMALKNESSIAVNRTNRYEVSTRQTSGDGLGDQLPAPQVIGAVPAGLSYGMSVDSFTTGLEAANAAVAPNCPSGDCIFGPFQTIGTGHICQNISNQIQRDGTNWFLPENAGLPNRLYLSHENGIVNTTTTDLYPDSEWFPVGHLGPLISNTYILADLYDPPFALECALFWSVYTITSKVNSTVGYSEYRYDSKTWPIQWNWTDTSIHTTTNQTNDIVLTPPHCFVNGAHIDNINDPKVLDPHDNQSECVFTVSALAHHGLQNYMLGSAYGPVGSYQMVNKPACQNCFEATAAFVFYLDALMKDAKAQNPSDSQDQAMDLIDNILFTSLDNSLMNAFRLVPRMRNASDPSTKYWMPCQGVQYDVPRFYVIWGVMAYPLMLMAGCTLFLLAVALKSRDNIWKRSSLPLLFHGLSPQDRASIGNIQDYGHMKEKAKWLDVHFASTKEGYQLVSDKPDWTGRD